MSSSTIPRGERPDFGTHVDGRRGWICESAWAAWPEKRERVDVRILALAASYAVSTEREHDRIVGACVRRPVPVLAPPRIARSPVQLEVTPSLPIRHDEIAQRIRKPSAVVVRELARAPCDRDDVDFDARPRCWSSASRARGERQRCRTDSEEDHDRLPSRDEGAGPLESSGHRDRDARPRATFPLGLLMGTTGGRRVIR
jgi:hypothetical protein